MYACFKCIGIMYTIMICYAEVYSSNFFFVNKNLEFLQQRKHVL